ncbi:MAG TPA: FtsX-like permease family protein [Ruminococcus sp.]|nr:FtsX-like permease family protein [Ruminococcus sp.]
MFWRILKKDLKRKKTMNIILLLFVIICSMFASASVNNIMAVTGGIDHYFDIAEVPDVTVSMSEDCEADKAISELPSVKSVKTEHYLTVMSSKHFTHNGKKLDNFINPANFLSADEMGMKYFDMDNKVISSVDKGDFYCTSPFVQKMDISEGDEVVLEIGDTTMPLTYKGCFKGALFSNDEMSSPYIIINNEDYRTLAKDKYFNAGSLSTKRLYVRTDDVGAVRDAVKGDDNVYLSTRDEEKGEYLYDMLTAYIMLVISIVLMLTAFVVLRFTIGFTLSEEFREIGVMKAVGIDNGSIRRLYIVKYLAISVAGAVIGYICSLPLSSAMMKTVSEHMVLEAEKQGMLGVISSSAVVVIIMLFCYGCTRKVKKLSPIDAVRSGQSGERARKKNFMHLGSSKLPTTGFLSCNDVMSAPKRFGIITAVFTLCMLLMTLMSNFAVTLKSENMLKFFGVPTCEAHIGDMEYMQDIFTDGTAYQEIIDKTEKMLAENDMPGSCTMSFGANYETFCKDKSAKLTYTVTKGKTDDEIKCDKGRAPENGDEIALTGYAMKELDADIGDKIKTVIDGEEREFTVTGKFSSFQGGGYAASLCRDFDFGNDKITTTMGVQIHFDGDPDKKTIDDNVSKISRIIESDKVYTTSEMIKQVTGMSDTLDTIKKMMMILTVIVTALIVILMERSFISKEKSEIALMKAVGMSNGNIIAQHTIRFAIVSVLACIVSTIILMPVSNLVMNWICSMIGDVSGLKCAFVPVEIFAVCPAILIGVAVIGSFLTALYMKTIKASDTASIE